MVEAFRLANGSTYYPLTTMPALRTARKLAEAAIIGALFFGPLFYSIY